MFKLNNGKQTIVNKQHRLGSHEEQPLLFGGTPNLMLEGNGKQKSYIIDRNGC